MIIPNLISPNNDGINDFWDLNDYLKNYSDAVIEVYDRFGKQIKVITKTEHFKWDGKIGGKPLPTDTYWFVIKLADKRIQATINEKFDNIHSCILDYVDNIYFIFYIQR